MVDFTSLLQKPAGEAKKPEALPAGDYHGVVKSFETGDSNKNKTPYVRFHIGIVAPGDAVASDHPDLAEQDLSKRQMRRDYYLTEDAMWRLDDFLKSLGIALAGKSYEETIPEAVGTQVLVEVQQYLNQTSNEIGNQIGKIVGQS